MKDQSFANSNNMYKEEELPFQYKTLKLSSLNEGKLIYFEEYEPEDLLTGGRNT